MSKSPPKNHVVQQEPSRRVDYRLRLESIEIDPSGPLTDRELYILWTILTAPEDSRSQGDRREQ